MGLPCLRRQAFHGVLDRQLKDVGLTDTWQRASKKKIGKWDAECKSGPTGIGRDLSDSWISKLRRRGDSLA